MVEITVIFGWFKNQYVCEAYSHKTLWTYVNCCIVWRPLFERAYCQTQTEKNNKNVNLVTYGGDYWKSDRFDFEHFTLACYAATRQQHWIALIAYERKNKKREKEKNNGSRCDWMPGEIFLLQKHVIVTAQQRCRYSKRV